ncbi:MAG: Nicotinate dehydrogenase small FeS subunit [Syntrophorhabdus sp. PtaB.Bin047]|nr:MAG: Nicotinate dehydrogenase small FeS subunit [Syntrophorhabdus sp. PtaB.Bin047]
MKRKISFTLNGSPVVVETDAARRAVDVLREDLGLTGTKEGCGSGECGACSILVDDVVKLSCIMTAAQLEGRRIVTIEGVGQDGELHPVQRSFVERGAIQCGFCTPGMVIAAVGFLKENPDPTREEIRAGLSGNICRCTGYEKIIDAVEDAAAKLRGGGSGG